VTFVCELVRRAPSLRNVTQNPAGGLWRAAIALDRRVYEALYAATWFELQRTELSSVALGASIVSCSDEFFAPASDLLKVKVIQSLASPFDFRI
jgi:hypothetical protein